MAEFKVGDRFKVVGNVDEHFDSFVGETGTIVENVDECGPVYRVLLDASDEHDVLDIYFFEPELEKLED